jgi:hypothetical protein
MRWLLAAAILCVASMTWAQSGNPNANSYGLRYDGKPDQRGTKAAPVFIEAEVTSSKSKGDADRDAEEEKGKAQRERNAIVIAGIAAAIAFMAACIAVAQLVMFSRQLRLMQDTAGEAKTAAESAKLQAQTMLEEYHATHVPKLVVRRVEFVERPEQQPFPGLEVQYVVTNVGDADAEIEGCDITLQPMQGSVGDALPSAPPYGFPDINNVLKGVKIPVGESTRHIAVAKEITERAAIASRQNLYQIVLLGWMQYRNPGGRRRYTAFCRVWHPHRNAWIKPAERDDTPEYDRYDYIS